MKQNIQSIGIFIFAGVIFLPVAVLAQDAYDRALEQGRQDCQKIADQIGEENPSVLTYAVGSDDFFAACDWYHSGYWRGYSSQIIEDVKIITNAIHFNRYNSEEAAKNDLENIIAVYSENTADNDTIVGGLITETKKTTDGFVSINKTDWVALSGDPAAAKDSDTSVIVGITRGNCLVSVSGDTMHDLDAIRQYHYFDPKTYKYVDRHPDFNHDREAELLLLARAKAEEILGILDCGEGTPVESSPVVVEALVEQRPTNKDKPQQAAPPTDDQKRRVQIVDFYKSETKKVERVYNTETETLYYRQWTATQDHDSGADVEIGGAWNPAFRGQVLTGDFTLAVWSGYRAKLKIGGMDIIVEGPVDVVISEDGDAQWRFTYGEKNGPWRSLDHMEIAPVDREGLEITPYTRFLEGNFKTDMKVSTPQVIAGVTGTDFAIAYDRESDKSIVEVYDGTVTVTARATGEIKTISSGYSQPIKRIEVAQDGTMTEQVAIPKDEWRERKAETASQVQSQENRSSGLFLIFVFLVLGGCIFWLYRTGKLQPIIRKILALVQRDASKPL